MKYRIILGNNDLRPFAVQRMNEKSFFKIWWNVDSFVRQQEAESFVRRVVELRAQHGTGKVIFEYEDADAVVERLKNKSILKNYESDGAMTEVGTSQAGLPGYPYGSIVK